MTRRKRHSENALGRYSRGASLIVANFKRGRGKSARHNLPGVYVTDRSKDKPPTSQGTRR